MMKILKRKNKKGFTLMEMLIVIGIIAVLVAIAIPTFSNANKKAKYAADQANVRAWYAEQLVANMTDDTPLPDASTITTIKLQMSSTATVKVSYISGKEKTAEGFRVTYDPMDKGFKAVTFPGAEESDSAAK